MTVIPIARYLSEFGNGRAPDPAVELRDDVLVLQSLDPRAIEERAREIEAASLRGHEAGYAAASAEFELRLADEQARREARASADREAWLAEEGRRLGEAMASAFERLEASIAASVTRILQPFMAQALREQALAALEETLSRLTSDEGALVRISGPESLLSALRERLGPSRSTIEYVVADGADIDIVAGNTLIESRLQAWTDHLAEATR